MRMGGGGGGTGGGAMSPASRGTHEGTGVYVGLVGAGKLAEA